MLRFKSLRMSGFRAFADARFAKAAIELTAGAEALAFMCTGMIKFDKGFP